MTYMYRLAKILRLLRVLKWVSSNQHHIQRYPTRPHICYLDMEGYVKAKIRKTVNLKIFATSNHSLN